MVWQQIGFQIPIRGEGWDRGLWVGGGGEDEEGMGKVAEVTLLMESELFNQQAKDIKSTFNSISLFLLKM